MTPSCKECWNDEEHCKGSVTDKFEHFIQKPKDVNEDYEEDWEKDDE